MTITPTIITGKNPSDLQAQANTALAALTTHYIRDVDFYAGDVVRYIAQEYAMSLVYDTGNPNTINPFQVTVYFDKSEAGVLTQASTFIAANPTYYFARLEISVDVMERNTTRAVAVLLYNTVYADGQGAYLPLGSRSGKRFVIADAATVTPNLINGSTQTWSIAGNRSLAAPLNMGDGDEMTLIITQTAGGNTIAPVAAYKFVGGSTALSAGAGAIDRLRIQRNGAVYLVSKDLAFA